MPIESRGGARAETVADLVARRDYERAIELVRKRLKGAPTSAALRLKLADLLVEAGRATEAVPLFLGLADDYVADGYDARARAALKRIERIEPGRADVESRMRALVQGRESGRSRPKPTPAPALTEEPVPNFTDTVVSTRRRRANEDTQPKLLLPGESKVTLPARRPRRRASSGENFLSMPEDALQDQIEDLLEGLFRPGVDEPWTIDAETAAAAREPRGEAAVRAAAEAKSQAAAAPSEGGITSLFDGLPSEERLALLRGLKLRPFDVGDVVATEGESPSGLCVITAGGLRFYTRDADGRNHEVGRLAEGDFFGEVASRSGLPRSATVVASAPGEMLEVDQDSLDQVAVEHPRVWARLHAIARARSAGHPAAEAPETAAPDDASEDPRWRLRLAQAFLRAGQKDEARKTLVPLAEELVRRGQSEMAVALLQKVERAVGGPGHVTPRHPNPPRPAPLENTAGTRRRPVVTDDKLGQWVKAVSRTGARTAAGRSEGTREAREGVETLADPATSEAYPGLRACLLFEGLGEEDLLDCVRGLPVETRAPGEILLTEGEPSDSLLVIARGRVKVFVRKRSGRDGLLCELGQGAFLGEIGVLAGLPRSATAVTSTRSLLLRVDRRSLEALCRRHPPARAVLEKTLEARATNQDEAPIRERTDKD